MKGLRPTTIVTLGPALLGLSLAIVAWNALPNSQDLPSFGWAFGVGVVVGLALFLPMTIPKERRIIACIAGAALVGIAGLAVLGLAFQKPSGPTLSCSSFNPESGVEVVELTNATTHSWRLQLYVAHGLPTLAYFVTTDKGIPGWGIEAEEGIFCSGYLYRRNALGGYSPPEWAGNNRAKVQITATVTNLVFTPHQVLRFSVPVADIHGLSRVGVKYYPYRAPPSSRLGRIGMDTLALLRRVLRLPAEPAPLWCEAGLSLPKNEH